MAYNLKIYKYRSGARSWSAYYSGLGPWCWEPESMLCRIIHSVLFVPWFILWIIGLCPMLLVLGAFGGFYNYIRYNEFIL